MATPIPNFWPKIESYQMLKERVSVRDEGSPEKKQKKIQ